MKKESGYKSLRRWAMLLALVLAAAIPIAAMAEVATQTAGAAAGNSEAAVYGQMQGRGMMGDFGPGCYGLDTGSLTEEQKIAYDSAAALYEQIEDSVLNDLVTAGVVAQADVDAYVAQHTAQKSLAELDQSGWTADQYKAFYEANAKTGDDRKAAMQALADAGQLTQAQADALSALGQSDLWAKIAQNADTNSDIQTALSTLRQARQAMRKALSDAGIAAMGRGCMGAGFGMSGMGKGGMNRGCMGAGLGMSGMGSGSGRMNGRGDGSNRMTGKNCG